MSILVAFFFFFAAPACQRAPPHDCFGVHDGSLVLPRAARA